MVAALLLPPPPLVAEVLAAFPRPGAPWEAGWTPDGGPIPRERATFFGWFNLGPDDEVTGPFVQVGVARPGTGRRVRTVFSLEADPWEENEDFAVLPLDEGPGFVLPTPFRRLWEFEERFGGAVPLSRALRPGESVRIRERIGPYREAFAATIPTGPDEKDRVVGRGEWGTLRLVNDPAPHVELSPPPGGTTAFVRLGKNFPYGEPYRYGGRFPRIRAHLFDSGLRVAVETAPTRDRIVPMASGPRTPPPPSGEPRSLGPFRVTGLNDLRQRKGITLDVGRFDLEGRRAAGPNRTRVWPLYSRSALARVGLERYGFPWTDYRTLEVTWEGEADRERWLTEVLTGREDRDLEQPRTSRFFDEGWERLADGSITVRPGEGDRVAEIRLRSIAEDPWSRFAEVAVPAGAKSVTWWSDGSLRYDDGAAIDFRVPTDRDVRLLIGDDPPTKSPITRVPRHLSGRAYDLPPRVSTIQVQTRPVPTERLRIALPPF